MLSGSKNWEGGRNDLRYKAAHRVLREGGAFSSRGQDWFCLLPLLSPQQGTITAVHHGRADCLPVDAVHLRWPLTIFQSPQKSST